MTTVPIVDRNARLPKIALAAADGARFEAYLHGAHVTSWHPAGSGDERLFLSPLAHFAAGEPIRGGIPVCFPQFADQGSLPMHGFARVVNWTLVDAARHADGAAHAVFRLLSDAQSTQLWGHDFMCELEVTAIAQSLCVELRVANTGQSPFDFTTALHTYLRVDEVGAIRISGVGGVRYRDKVLREDDVLQRAPTLVVDRPIDRVYRAVPDVVEVHEAGRALRVSAHGTTDTVIWNPGPGKASPNSDLAPDAYSSFVCVEAAVASTPVTLQPSQRWTGSQTLTAG